MLKLLCVYSLLHLTVSQDKNNIDQFFQDFKEQKTEQSLKCTTVEGSAHTCLACYTCDHKDITSKKLIKKFNLTLRDGSCNKEMICCIEAEDLAARQNYDGCGKRNPNGEPYSRRPSLRAVLEREFPWRAWIYRSGSEQPLCAASYIYNKIKGLLTTASCVNGYQSSDLQVKFTKTQKNPNTVKRIVLHEHFKKNVKGGNNNDIAVLVLNEDLDPRVKHVCLSLAQSPLQFGSSCVIVSDTETSINTLLTQPKRCASDGVNIERNVTCTYLVKNDYTPQRGAGLYCLDEHSSTPTYVLHGIYQDDQSTSQKLIYTNISSYKDWIYSKTNSIYNLYNQKPL